MKTMTCKQMGGPCDMAMQGNTADEIIKAGDKHLREMVANGDESHKAALAMMDERWKNPAGGMEWYQKMQSDFAAMPED